MNGRDTVTLIDDYAPAKTPRQKIDLEEKLERIIRMVGDRSTKSRSNTNLEDCRGEGVKGTVVLTGELIGKGLSSNLRCFYCGIQRECVNEDVVTYFQDNPYSFTTVIQYFAFFIGERWEEFVDYIKRSFPKEREIIRNSLTERRLVDSAAVLRLTCEIIRAFLIECGINTMEVNRMIEEMQKGVLMMAAISENISLEETPAVRFVKVIDQLLQSRKLNMIMRRPTEEDLGYIDGFNDGEFYYFLPDNLYEKVKRVFYSTNIYLPLNLDEMVKALAEEGISIPSSNGQGKKVYYARVLIEQNKKRNFIKIRKDVLQKIANES